MNLNKIILMGRITADPEIKKTQSDISVCRFTVAVNRRDKEKTTDFIECSAFRNTADFIGKYFRKGSAIIVCGSLQTNNFTDKDGNKRKSYSVIADEVQFGEKKNAERPGTPNVGAENFDDFFSDATEEGLPF